MVIWLVILLGSYLHNVIITDILKKQKRLLFKSLRIPECFFFCFRKSLKI